MKKRVLSGMRPTGSLHLGNFFGALKNWVDIQEQYECYYMVADMHALTSDAAFSREIRSRTREMVADWLACGINPAKSTIFVQSAIHEHAELHYILSCITPLGWLERSPAYKEAVRGMKQKDLGNYGFLGYPVLQTADILLYKGNYVPVGEDQVPHLELAREIVRKFHYIFSCDIFPEPKPLLTQSAKIVGLDGENKMSKSLGNEISLSEAPEGLKKKVLSMFTDPQRPRKSDRGHPENCNAFSFHKMFGNDRCQEIARSCRSAELGCVDCKKELYACAEAFIAPIRDKRNELLDKGEHLDEIIEEGNTKAKSCAKEVLEQVKGAVYG